MFCKMRTIFESMSYKDTQNIISILDEKNIKYRLLTSSHSDNVLLLGRGGARSFGGNTFSAQPTTVYEVLVPSEQYELVSYYIKNIK